MGGHGKNRVFGFLTLKGPSKGTDFIDLRTAPIFLSNLEPSHASVGPAVLEIERTKHVLRERRLMCEAGIVDDVPDEAAIRVATCVSSEVVQQ